MYICDVNAYTLSYFIFSTLYVFALSYSHELNCNFGLDGVKIQYYLTNLISENKLCLPEFLFHGV